MGNLSEELRLKIARLRLIATELQGRKNQFYYSYEPAHDDALSFHRCLSRIRIVQGGIRSGKTTAAIKDISMQCLHEHPYWKAKENKKGEIYPVTWWLVVPSFKKYFSMWRGKLKAELPENRFELKENTNKNIYFFEADNGSRIVIKSQEEDIKEFGGESIDGALIDERFTDEEKRLQLRGRIVERDGSMVFTTDSIEADEWIKELSQLDYATVFRFDMERNRFLSQEAVAKFKEELDELDRERLVYGRHKEKGVISVFPPDIWTERNKKISTPAVCEVTDNGVVENQNGNFLIFKYPEPGKRYVLGIDGADGLAKTDGRNDRKFDESIIQVISADGEQVAVWASNKYPPVIFASICVEIGKMYNRAVLAPENRGKAGGLIIQKMIDLKYSNIYYETNSFYKGTEHRTDFGINTNAKSKADMIHQLRDDIVNERMLLVDAGTFEQLENFVMFEKVKEGYNGKFAGLPGKRDDKVMALVMANRVLNAWGYFKKNNSAPLLEKPVDRTEELLQVYKRQRSMSINSWHRY